MPTEIPAAPIRLDPEANWAHYELFRRLRDAILSLPFYFRTETFISGVMATDIFTLNATLGATIEEQVVETLNEMRPIWDPDDRYRAYGFVRQSQTFPDVLFKRYTPDPQAAEIILGLELKGWYLLAKEGEPSFRFTVTPAVCNAQDLIVVVPWALSNVISGSPRVFQPFVESARYAAQYRNYHWQFLRHTSLDTEIRHPENVRAYPRKSDQIADRPVHDPGGNFGRLARTAIMDEYVEAAKTHTLAGIQARHWLAFFKVFQERRTTEEIGRELESLAQRLAAVPQVDEADVQRVRVIINELEHLLINRT